MTLRAVPLLFAAGLSSAGPISTVADGDTFVLNGERVRLWGIDAPEGRQVCRDRSGREYRCGDVAREKLVELVASKPVTCRPRDRDGYGRTVSQCYVGSLDIGEAMVRSGWAVEYGQYSQGFYASAEADARKTRRGLWIGQFERPEVWRAAARTERSPPPIASGSCVLKGNINAKGRKILHAPGQQDYAATVIDPTRGERWFCNTAQAVAAGWTPAAR